MLSRLLPCLAFVALPVLANTITPRFCSVTPPSQAWRDSIQDVIQDEKTGAFTGFAEDTAIDTYIHVVTISQRPEDGYLSNSTISKQMEVLNDDFKGTGFTFVLKDVDWTVHQTWGKDGAESAMKKALRKGGYAALNLYFVSEMGRNGYAGYCYYPTDPGSPGSQVQITDGCTMTWKITPGGPLTENNMGRVTSHEVRHWAGLIHTFEGGCNRGDEVEDTNPQAAASRGGCPIGQKSCGSIDHIHNQMDYTNDKCRTEITKGQTTRMQGLYNKFRKGK